MPKKKAGPDKPPKPTPSKFRRKKNESEKDFEERKAKALQEEKVLKQSIVKSKEDIEKIKTKFEESHKEFEKSLTEEEKKKGDEAFEMREQMLKERGAKAAATRKKNKEKKEAEAKAKQELASKLQARVRGAKTRKEQKLMREEALRREREEIKKKEQDVANLKKLKTILDGEAEDLRVESERLKKESEFRQVFMPNAESKRDPQQTEINSASQKKLSEARVKEMRASRIEDEIRRTVDEIEKDKKRTQEQDKANKDFEKDPEPLGAEEVDIELDLTGDKPKFTDHTGKTTDDMHERARKVWEGTEGKEAEGIADEEMRRKAEKMSAEEKASQEFFKRLAEENPFGNDNDYGQKGKLNRDLFLMSQLYKLQDKKRIDPRDAILKDGNDAVKEMEKQQNLRELLAYESYMQGTQSIINKNLYELQKENQEKAKLYKIQKQTELIEKTNPYFN